MSGDGTFALYGNDSLYSAVAGESATFTVPGSPVAPGSCATRQATITVTPAKNSGRLQESDVVGSLGWIVARVENTSDCIPEGVYDVMAPKSKAAIVVRPSQSRGYQADVVPFRAPRIQATRLQFCDHQTGLRVDRVRYYTFDPAREAPCDALLARRARPAAAAGSPTPDDGPNGLLALSCGLDDCVASLPPTRSQSQPADQRRTLPKA
ncbi:MAG: hypothetical protein ABJF01_00460 [bacterium]